MPPIRRLPYLTPLPTRVNVQPWWLARPGRETVRMPAVLPDWDPSVNLSASTNVRVDVPGIFDDCQLDPDAVLRLGVIWSSEGTRLRGIGTGRDLRIGIRAEDHQLSVDVAGTLLRQNLMLTVQLLLVSTPTRPPNPFAPAIPGSRLLAHSAELVVEGIGSRFPTEIVDFTAVYFPSNAAWTLFWDPQDLHQTVAGDMRLYINSRNQTVVRAISENRPEDHGIREAIRYDVAQQLIYGAISNSEFIEAPESFDRGSVGAAVRSMMRTYFPNYPLKLVIQRAQRPAIFNAELQERLRLFWEATQ